MEMVLLHASNLQSAISNQKEQTLAAQSFENSRRALASAKRRRGNDGQPLLAQEG
jgi:hypothetical protein